MIVSFLGGAIIPTKLKGSAGWAESCIQISRASQPDKEVNLNLVFRRRPQ